MAMELKVIENVQKLSCNFEEINKELAETVAKYTGLVVNEDNLQDMERTQKEIASLRIKITKFKTTTKREYIKPYEVFEHQVKQLLELVEDAEKPIKDQIEKYEDMRREQKRIACQKIITDVSADLGLMDKYSSQIVVDSKWLNKGPTVKEITKEVQVRVCWYLEIQAKEVEAETFRQQKIEMAKFLCESLSAGLVTPVTFAEIENRIEQLDIAALKANIEGEVARRREREERAKEAAERRILEQQEKDRQEAEKRESERIRKEQETESKRLQQEEHEAIRKQAEFERNQGLLTNSDEHLQKLVEANEPPQKIINDENKVKLYNAEFVLLGITEEQYKAVKQMLVSQGFDVKTAVQEVKKAV